MRRRDGWIGLGIVVAVSLAGCSESASETPTTTEAAMHGESGGPSASPTGAASATPDASMITVADAESEGELDLAWQAAGPDSAKPCTSHPVIAPEGNVWVASCWGDAFWIFSPEGEFIEAWGESGSQPGAFNFSYGGGSDAIGGAAFASDGSFYTFEAGNLRVQHFDADRNLITSWGSFGTDDGQFAKPTSIGVDGDDQVYVADASRGDVQVFAADGTYLRTIAQGWLGARTGTFAYMAVTSDGNIYLSNWGKVRAFATDGTPLAAYDLTALTSDCAGVAVDEQGHIYVAGFENDNPRSTIELDSDGSVLHVWEATGEMLAIQPDTRAVYATHPNRSYVRKYELPQD